MTGGPANLGDKLGERLMSACESGNAEAVYALLAAGANPDFRVPTGETPLIKAAAQGATEVIQLLADAGAEIDGRSAAGSTPLMFAAHRGQSAAIGLLLALGADRAVHNNKNLTAADYARANHHHEALNVLTESPDQVSFTYALGARIMEEVFDFNLQERITLLHSAGDGKVEAMLRDPFSQLDEASNLRRAFNIHRQRGGKVPEDEIFTRELPKRRLPGMGGDKV